MCREQSGIYQIPDYQFVHGLAVLLSPDEWRQDEQHPPNELRKSYGGEAYHMYQLHKLNFLVFFKLNFFDFFADYLHVVYMELLASLADRLPPCKDAPPTSISEPYCASYNLVMTTEYVKLCLVFGGSIDLVHLGGCLWCLDLLRASPHHQFMSTASDLLD